MTIIVVTQRVEFHPDRNEQRDVLDGRLVEFLVLSGYIPVPIPNSLYSKRTSKIDNRIVFDTWLERINPQGILLSGGDDIGESQERDLVENWLLDFAEINCCPVLGLCRGMQMLAVWAGTKLKRVDGHVRTRHVLTGEITDSVNSFHTQSLALCPPNYSVLARSEDNEIEAIRHQSLPWEGWMWHPEREKEFSTFDMGRVRELFE